MQITDTLLMIRPASFGYNSQTAVNNSFQKIPTEDDAEIQAKALLQFENAVQRLREEGVQVMVIDDTAQPVKPDAVFPNNWLSTTPEGIVHIFPMYAANRRAEKRDDILKILQDHFIISDACDWTEYEAEAMYLEGTGSMVMDHQNRVVYAALSPRTHKTLVEKFGAAAGYRAITFLAADSNGMPIYHTNVLLCIGEGFAVLCPKCITDDTERVAVAQLLEASGHENIYIEPDQMACFAGNMLHVRTASGHRVIVMSKAAHDCLQQDQKERLERHGTLLPIDVSCIEAASGGSIRCMIGEIFLQPKGQAAHE
jgi:hypothetical protein